MNFIRKIFRVVCAIYIYLLIVKREDKVRNIALNKIFD